MSIDRSEARTAQWLLVARGRCLCRCWRRRCWNVHSESSSIARCATRRPYSASVRQRYVRSNSSRPSASRSWIFLSVVVELRLAVLIALLIRRRRRALVRTLSLPLPHADGYWTRNGLWLRLRAARAMRRRRMGSYRRPPLRRAQRRHSGAEVEQLAHVARVPGEQHVRHVEQVVELLHL